MDDLEPIGLRLEPHHEPLCFSGLLTWTGAFTSGTPWFPACWLYILGIVSLHNQVSQFPVMHIFMENKNKWNSMYVSVQFICSVMSDFSWPLKTVACLYSLSSISQSLLKHMFIESLMPSSHLIICCLFLLLPSIFPRIRVFFSELDLCIRWPKDWNFSFSISAFKECSGLISFRIDWFDLLAIQGTLKSLLQHHSLKASILQCSAFFMVQL